MKKAKTDVRAVYGSLLALSLLSLLFPVIVSPLFRDKVRRAYFSATAATVTFLRDGDIAWELCDESAGASHLGSFEMKDGTTAFVLAGDLNEISCGGAAFPVFFEERNATCVFGSKRAQSKIVKSRKVNFIEARVDGHGWTKCRVVNAYLINVVVCPGVSAQIRAMAGASQIQTLSVSIRDYRLGDSGGDVTAQFCRRKVARKTDVTMCTAFVSGMPSKRLLAEFVEYHRLIRGIDRFVIYDRTTSPDGRSYADYARELGYDGTVSANITVSARRWQGLTRRQENIAGCSGYYDQAAALSHCMWEARRKSRYVAVVDIDEWLFDSRINTLATVPHLVDTVDAELEQNEWISCALMAYLDFGGMRSRDDNDVVISQFTQLSKYQSGLTKVICVPERVWASTIHREVRVGGGRSYAQKSNLNVAHYNNLFWQRYPTDEANVYSWISDTWGGALKSRIIQLITNDGHS